ncbi:MFS transporter (plasmid) [Streptomyces sp. NBC_01591]|uniref:MFS transporter n=1 Tax=Streptomyces sp. NBC_01591 TaxID=2975888 RepID=UPI002DD97098|nr:MFS transporter [Streptomyces sp. NBC_01591]WSD73891.1 MFS transporter [Streptomyces sp. NBC_01591]
MSGIRRSELWSGVVGLPGPLRFLLVTSFFMPLASFMILPYLAILLHDRLGMAMGPVGLLLGVTSFLQFAGALGGGLVAERIGWKRSMVTGLTVRTAGFALFAVGLTKPAVAVVAVLLTALGDTLYSPANKAYLVSEVSEEHRPVLLSVNNSALSSGMALGTLASGLLISRMPLLVFTVVAVMFAAMTVTHLVLLPGTPATASAAAARDRRGDWGRAFLTAPVLVALATAYVYWYFQNYLGLFVTATHSTFLYSTALILNSALVVLGQPPAARWIGRIRYVTAVLIAFPALTLGLLVLARPGVAFVLLGTVLISVAEGVLFLKNELEALRAVPDRPTLAVGSQRLALGGGSLLSGIVGGQLYAVSQPGGSTGQFWLYAAGQAVVVTVLAAAACRVRRTGRPAHVPALSAPSSSRSES